ncbi:MAG TPA: hypothetical protein VGM06_16970 [Polyangiaceae bacterium]
MDRSSFTVGRYVGRLVEIRLFHLGSVDTIAELSRLIAGEARSAQALTVIFGDYRRTRPFSQEVGDAWSRAMRGFNESVAWSAILLARSNETFNLQIERVVRCAVHPARRLFWDARELREWVGPRATAAELSRLDPLLRDGA